VTYLDALGVLGPRTLVIHGVQVDQADAEILSLRCASVVLCPRSNLRHGHGPPPVRRYLAAGTTLGVGTDSVVSVETLDLFADARLVAELGGLDPDAALRAMTLDGARALGLDSTVGSLAPGKEADLCLVAAVPGARPGDAVADLLSGGATGVRCTWVAGRLVHGELPAGAA
jgi:5-methylthioadenosine/S-adenosylhomocysteine deaminase